ncbi:MAG: PIN domain-containing protein [Planctomycetota bacterium]|jgi:predicted nucleic acid-binding protein
MIFVETTVWREILRFAESRRTAHFRRLIDLDRVALAAPVRTEILCAAPPDQRRRLQRMLSALPVYYPTKATWKRIDRWIHQTAEVFGTGHLLIASIAADHEGELWTRDRTFTRMAMHGFVELHSG